MLWLVTVVGKSNRLSVLKHFFRLTDGIALDFHAVGLWVLGCFLLVPIFLFTFSPEIPTIKLPLFRVEVDETTSFARSLNR